MTAIGKPLPGPALAGIGRAHAARRRRVMPIPQQPTTEAMLPATEAPPERRGAATLQVVLSLLRLRLR
jgi:hypothetical protein